MNTRIEELTRTYLNSLNLPYHSRLDDNQKQKIIEINSQTEWIIFNAGSLKASPLRRGYTDPAHYSYQEYSTETYEITSSILKELLKEQIKSYHRDDVDPNNISVKIFQFNGGSGVINDRKQDAIPRERETSSKGNKRY